MKILVVDDNETNLSVYFQLLARLGFEVQTQSSSRKAYELAQSEKFDCIIMDVHMPHLNGIELTKLLRESEGKQKVPPAYLISVSSDDSKVTREQFRNAGGDVSLRLPVTRADLSAAIQKISPAGRPS